MQSRVNSLKLLKRFTLLVLVKQHIRPIGNTQLFNFVRSRLLVFLFQHKFLISIMKLDFSKQNYMAKTKYTEIPKDETYSILYSEYTEKVPLIYLTLYSKSSLNLINCLEEQKSGNRRDWFVRNIKRSFLRCSSTTRLSSRLTNCFKRRWQRTS